MGLRADSDILLNRLDVEATASQIVSPPRHEYCRGPWRKTQALGGSPERKFEMKNGTKKHHEKPELSELLARLDVASKRLNTLAEEASRRIQSLDERLVEAEPGITVWGSTLLRESVTFAGDAASTPETAERAVTLGFAKVKKDKWGLAVREVLTAKNGRLLAEESTLLSKAERQLRLLAVPHLTALTRQVVEAIEAQTAAFGDDQAEKDAQAQATLTING
jgi:hypothetical protein